MPASFSSSARCPGAGRPASRRARVNSNSVFASASERVYSFLKRDVVRRIEEQSSVPVISSSQTFLLFPFHFQIPPQFGCFLAAGRGVAKVCPRGLGCASASRSSVYVGVCATATSGNQVDFPIQWWIRAKPMMFWSRDGWLRTCCNRDWMIHSVFNFSVTFSRVVVFPSEAATAGGVCGYYPPPSVVHRSGRVPAPWHERRALARRVVVRWP